MQKGNHILAMKSDVSVNGRTIKSCNRTRAYKSNTNGVGIVLDN